MLFPNPCNGHRSMRATSGSTRQRDSSFPTRLSLNSARILGVRFFVLQTSGSEGSAEWPALFAQCFQSAISAVSIDSESPK